jgi:hypothetical protein
MLLFQVFKILLLISISSFSKIQINAINDSEKEKSDFDYTKKH